LFCFFEIIATSRVIASSRDEEESPDSIEQCTGEKPGAWVKTRATDSATENYYSEWRKGENVR